jgi:hypothetical protein
MEMVQSREGVKEIIAFFKDKTPKEDLPNPEHKKEHNSNTETVVFGDTGSDSSYSFVAPPRPLSNSKENGIKRKVYVKRVKQPHQEVSILKGEILDLKQGPKRDDEGRFIGRTLLGSIEDFVNHKVVVEKEELMKSSSNTTVKMKKIEISGRKKLRNG